MNQLFGRNEDENIYKVVLIDCMSFMGLIIPFIMCILSQSVYNEVNI